MREYKIIAAFTATLVLIVAVYFFHTILNPGAGELDELAVHRIATACAYRQECKVNLQDLFAGDWDTFWEFAPGTSQQQLDQALPNSGLTAPGPKRLIVLTRQNTVSTHAYQPAGNSPIDHQLVFEDAARNEPPILRYPRNTWLWATAKPAPAGQEVYYRLSPDNR